MSLPIAIAEIADYFAYMRAKHPEMTDEDIQEAMEEVTCKHQAEVL